MCTMDIHFRYCIMVILYIVSCHNTLQSLVPRPGTTSISTLRCKALVCELSVEIMAETLVIYSPNYSTHTLHIINLQAKKTKSHGMIHHE